MRGVLRAVDEPEQVALVPVPEAENLVLGHDVADERLPQQPGEFERRVHVLAADVEEQVTGRGGRGVRVVLDGAERVQLRRARGVVHVVPQLGTDADDAAEIGLGGAESGAVDDARDLRERLADPPRAPPARSP
nr:hypothetical protein [Mobilicoccus pelagius]